jgi:urate oxidase
MEEAMSDQSAIELFKKELFKCLEETFQSVRGVYLDKGTSLFETLDSVSAEDASSPAVENGATVAAHVEHVRFYLDVLNEVIQKEEVMKVDWREIWQNIRAVTPEEWEGQKRRLRESYERVLNTLKNYDRWEGEYGISCSLGILAHTAYHLGGIRQALGVVRRT